MSDRTNLHKMLCQAGFILVRSSKHLIYKNSFGKTIAVPNHNKMNSLTYKRIVKEISK